VVPSVKVNHQPANASDAVMQMTCAVRLMRDKSSLVVGAALVGVR
jgi:hypothetical protein